jgi:hypothetical protein
MAEKIHGRPVSQSVRRDNPNESYEKGGNSDDLKTNMQQDSAVFSVSTAGEHDSYSTKSTWGWAAAHA